MFWEHPGTWFLFHFFLSKYKMTANSKHKRYIYENMMNEEYMAYRDYLQKNKSRSEQALGN